MDSVDDLSVLCCLIRGPQATSLLHKELKRCEQCLPSSTHAKVQQTVVKALVSDHTTKLLELDPSSDLYSLVEGEVLTSMYLFGPEVMLSFNDEIPLTLRPQS